MFELALRIGLSLFIVLVLMWGLARLVRRPLGGNRHAGELSVLNRQQLSRNASVAVIRVADRAIVVGITEQQVSLLTEAPLLEFAQEHLHERRDVVDLEDDHEHVPPDLPEAHPHTLRGRLDGSLLSPRTWTATLDFLRDRTTRRP